MVTRESRLDRFAGLERLARDQDGAVSRRQALALGVTDAAIAGSLAAHRWQRVHPGVYAVFTGELPEATRVWAALLWAGPGAVLAGSTALRQWGVAGVPDDGRVHVAVEHGSRVRGIAGVVVRRRRHLSRVVHPARRPPTVRVEDAALHVAAAAASASAGLSVIADVCRQRLTTAARLREALAALPRLAGRRTWTAVLEDVATGAHSLLELTYLRRVERAHGLPRPVRQRAGASLGRRVWRDGEYPGLGVILELDGRLGHEWDTDRRHDRRRDLVVAGSGGLTLRQGYPEVLDEPCETAALVARVLCARGWCGEPVTCGPGCRLPAYLQLLDKA